MGNLTFILPVSNKENYNTKFILNELRKNFKDLIFEQYPDDVNSVAILKKVNTNKYKDFVMNIYFKQECYILDFDRDLKNLKEGLSQSDDDKTIDRINTQINELYLLKKTNVDLSNSIQSTYGFWNDDKNDVDFFIKDLFKGYIFDEGIHPEFIGPNYVRRKKNKSLIKKFTEFFK